MGAGPDARALAWLSASICRRGRASSSGDAACIGARQRLVTNPWSDSAPLTPAGFGSVNSLEINGLSAWKMRCASASRELRSAP